MTSLPFSRLPNPLKPPVAFRLSIPDSNLADFKTLLRLSKIPAPTFETLQEDGKYGLSHKWMTAAKARWEEGFDWRAREKYINSFPAFTSKVGIDIDGVGKQEYDIHFTGIFSEKVDAVPILLLHGWPGSFLEFLPLLDLMRKQYTPQTLPYHLIAPSMPGYPLSSPPPLTREFGWLELPQIYNRLMLDLGFSSYIAQGGDIGSRIARLLAVNFEECKAVHLNFSPITPPKDFDISTLTTIEKSARVRAKAFADTGRGYMIEHATRPGTLGLVLGSSPLALLGWIAEKFLEWSDVSPDLDTILETVTLYWFCEYGGNSVWPYRQRAPSGKVFAEEPGAEEFFIRKPLGYSLFVKEISGSPWERVALSGDLVFHREHDKGGHFAAFEQPELFKKDLEDFVEQVWKK